MSFSLPLRILLVLKAQLRASSPTEPSPGSRLEELSALSPPPDAVVWTDTKARPPAQLQGSLQLCPERLRSAFHPFRDEQTDPGHVKVFGPDARARESEPESQRDGPSTRGGLIQSPLRPHRAGSATSGGGGPLHSISFHFCPPQGRGHGGEENKEPESCCPSREAPLMGMRRVGGVVPFYR